MQVMKEQCGYEEKQPAQNVSQEFVQLAERGRLQLKKPAAKAEAARIPGGSKTASNNTAQKTWAETFRPAVKLVPII